MPKKSSFLIAPSRSLNLYFCSWWLNYNEKGLIAQLTSNHKFFLPIIDRKVSLAIWSSYLSQKQQILMCVLSKLINCNVLLRRRKVYDIECLKLNSFFKVIKEFCKWKIEHLNIY